MEEAMAALRKAARRIRDDAVAHRHASLAGALVVAAAGALALHAMPDRYQANARLYVDTQTVLKPLMEGLTFQEDIDRQVRAIARTLITRPNVERIAKAAGVGGIVGAEASTKDAVVTRLLTRLQVLPAGTENVYEIRYRDTDAARAQAVVQATLDLFVSEGMQGKQRDSRDAGRFIDDQIRDAEAKLTAAEDKLKEFKKRHFGLTGVSSQDYFTRISALSEEVSKLRIELGSAMQSRNAYRRELEEDLGDPLQDLRTAPPALSELQARLETQQKLVDELRLRYTDAHPDLVNGRRNLAELQSELQRRKDEYAAQSRSPRGRRTAQAGNPLYQKLRASLAEAEAQVAGLQAQLGNKQTALDEARAAVGRMPQVEAELVQLNRDYDVIRKNYDALVSRREAASLGAKLDQSSHLAEFRLVEPSRVSDTPVFPSRAHLAWATVLATLVAALGTGQVLRALRPTVDDVPALVRLSGRPVIGAVSLRLSEDAQRSERRQLMLPLAIALVLVVFQSGWAAWITLHSRIW